MTLIIDELHEYKLTNGDTARYTIKTEKLLGRNVLKVTDGVYRGNQIQQGPYTDRVACSEEAYRNIRQDITDNMASRGAKRIWAT